MPHCYLRPSPVRHRAVWMNVSHRMTSMRARTRGAFTLLESVIAIALTAVAGSALLLGVTSSLDAVHHAVDQTIAQGMAEQLLDEILGKRYVEGTDPYEVTLGATGYEKGGAGRERYNDIDDYHGYSSSPPKDYWGIKLGTDDGAGATRNAAFQTPATAFATWRQTVQVYYINNSDLSQRLASGTSNYRAVEVEVFNDDPVRGTRRLASIRRVISYIPSP